MPSFQAIHYVACAGKNKLLEILLKKAKYSHTLMVEIFRLAAFNGHELCLKLIHQHSKTTANIVEGVGGSLPTLVTPIDWKKKDANGGTALHAASGRGMLHATKFLLEMGANIEARDDFGLTPLLIAIGHQNLEVVEMLLYSGADINARGIKGDTALINSTRSSDLALMHLLSKYNVDITATDYDGRDALHAAVGSFDGPDAAEILISMGGDVMLADNSGTVALQLAMENKAISESWILEHLPEKDTVRSLRFGYLLNTACFHSKQLVVKELLTRASESAIHEYINHRSSIGTPLYTAALVGELEIISVLIDRGVEINTVGGPKGTALMAACEMGNIEGVKLLLRKGAKLEIETINGRSFSAKKAARSQQDISFLLARYEESGLHALDEPLPIRISNVEKVAEIWKSIQDRSERAQSQSSDMVHERNGTPPNIIGPSKV